LENRDDDYRGDREMNIKMMLDRVEENRLQKDNEIASITKRMQSHWDKITGKVDVLLPKEEIYDDKYKLLTSISDKNWMKAIDKSRRSITRLNQQVKTSLSRIGSYSTTMNRYLVEIHKKFSIPFSAIIFILVGAPLGISARKGSLGVGATLSIVFFLVYWVGLILGEDLADRRLFTPMLAMWLPNILIGIAGILLTWRAVKERNIIKFEKFEQILKKIKKRKEGTTVAN
jgi:lipopolysaccharide export system permease protein